MPTSIVIGLGELLWDCFPDGRRPGGAPANFAFHASQFGAEGLVASRVGADADGGELRAVLKANGLSTRLVQVDAAHPTGRVTVELEDGEPRYQIHEEVAWDYLAPEAELLDAMSLAAAVCFGTLAQRSPVSRATIHDCLAATGDRTLIVYDVNLRQDWFSRDWVERSLHSADVVKLNDHEWGQLNRLLDLEATGVEDFARISQERFGLGLVCITRGAKGCLLFSEDESVESPAEPVTVADAVGAGDAFTAALIVGLLAGASLEEIGTYANRVGGLVASRHGGMPRIADDLPDL